MVGTGRQDEKPKALPKGLSPDEAAALAVGESSNDAAVQEARQFATGEPANVFKKKAEENEADRTEKFRDHFERVSIWAMYSLFVTMFILGAIWLLHMVLPESCSTRCNLMAGVFQMPPICRWLSPEQVVVIQDILTGGLIAGLLAEHIRKRLGPNGSL